MNLAITPFETGEESEIPIEILERKERDERVINWFERVFHILSAYQSHQSTAKQLRMSLMAMEYALGFHLAAGSQNYAELARRCGVTKWTFGKCVEHFIQQVNLEPLPFQRNKEARANMAIARKEQLTT